MAVELPRFGGHEGAETVTRGRALQSPSRMPVYSWEGRSAKGAVVRGELEAPTEARPAEPGRPARHGIDGFTLGFLVLFTAIGIGVGFIAPVLDYDCARDAAGSVDCVVHKRAFGLVPRGAVRLAGIRTVTLVIGESRRTMIEQQNDWRQFGSARPGQSWEALLLVTRDGSSWQSDKSGWPLGRPIVDLVNGIDGLLKAAGPARYRAWTADKTSLMVSGGFFVPLGFVLLGLVLRLVVPRTTAEKWKGALEAFAAELRRRRRSRPDA